MKRPPTWCRCQRPPSWIHLGCDCVSNIVVFRPCCLSGLFKVSGVYIRTVPINGLFFKSRELWEFTRFWRNVQGSRPRENVEFSTGFPVLHTYLDTDQLGNDSVVGTLKFSGTEIATRGWWSCWPAESMLRGLAHWSPVHAVLTVFKLFDPWKGLDRAALPQHRTPHDAACRTKQDLEAASSSMEGGRMAGASLGEMSMATCLTTWRILSSPSSRRPCPGRMKVSRTLR